MSRASKCLKELVMKKTKGSGVVTLLSQPRLEMYNFWKVHTKVHSSCQKVSGLTARMINIKAKLN